MRRRVVITGIGTLNACGEGRDAFWQSAIASRSGISEISPETVGSLPVRAFGSLRDFDPNKYVTNRKSLKVMCRDISIAVACSYLAREDAGLADGVLDHERTGTCIGAGLFNHDLEELSEPFRSSIAPGIDFDTRRFGEEGMSKLFPLWLLKYLPNMPACHISIAHDLQGPSNTITADSASSAAAMEEAFHVIQRGMADMMFCGGAESRKNPSGILRYVALGLANANGTPHRPYPVFSRNDQGFVIGEGGAILILEELEHAVKRNARIYAELAAVYSHADTAWPENEDVHGRARSEAMRGALEEAGAAPQDIDAVHLNANGILLDDLDESRAVDEVFGAMEKKPCLVRTKGLTGYLGFAAASTESALAAMSICHGRLVPSGDDEDLLLSDRFSFSTADEALTGRQKRSRIRYILINQFSRDLSLHSIVLRTMGD